MFKRSSSEESQSPIEMKLDFDKLQDDLFKNGYTKEQVESVIERLDDNLSETVSEKRVLSYDDFFGAVTQAIGGIYDIPGNRLKLCDEIDNFVDQNPEVSNSVKLYASYIVFGAAEIKMDEYEVVLSGDDTNVVSAAYEYIAKWEERTKIRRTFFQIAKDVVKYGDAFYEKILSNDRETFGLFYIPANTMLIKLDEYGQPVKYYQILDNTIKFADMSDITQTQIQQFITDKKVIEFEPNEIFHFNDGTSIGFSDAPIRNLVVLWKFFKLLEQALTIHRVTRARRFIVFFLDVTGKTKKQIRESIRNFTRKIKRIFNIDVKSGSLYSNRSTVTSSSDLVIPITSESKTKVQTIPSDPSASKTEDLSFYLERLVTNLLTSHILSPNKSGKEEYVEKAFLRIVKIYQKLMSYTIEDIYHEILYRKGFKDVRVSITFPNPDMKEEIKLIDTIVRRMMIVNQMIATLGVVPPNKWVVKYVFKDLNFAEINELTQMLDFEKKKQENEAEGEESPTLFEEEEVPENTTESFKFDENENISDFLISDMSSRINEKKQHQNLSNIERIEKAINMSLRYLEMQNKNNTP